MVFCITTKKNLYHLFIQSLFILHGRITLKLSIIGSWRLLVSFYILLILVIPSKDKKLVPRSSRCGILSTGLLSFSHGRIFPLWWNTGHLESLNQRKHCFWKLRDRSRFREALWVNAKFYIWIVVIGGVAGVWFFFASDMYIFPFFFHNFSSFVSLQGWIIGLSNTYGLCFVVLLLGVGLVELPVK